MTLPVDSKTPLIMVGPGTGVAAFISFVQHLNRTETPMVLIFGCRDETKDYYYQELLATIPNLTVITAFSRSKGEGEGKQYVQHAIRENAEHLAGLI